MTRRGLPQLVPVRALWLLGGVCGIAFLVTTPPGDPPDEAVHYARAFLISEGRLSPVGQRPGYAAAVPRSIVDLHGEREGSHHTPEQLRRFGFRPRPRASPHSAGELLDQLRRPLAPGRRYRMLYVSSYSPVPYLHQAAAVWVGRKLGWSVGGILYLARAANLAVFLAAVAVAVRWSPIRHWTLTMLALSPAALFLAASVSADPPTIAIAYVVVALGWRAACEGGALGQGLRWGFVGACTLLGLAKPGYWPLAGLALAVPRLRFESRRSRASWLLLVAAAALLPSLAWMLYVSWLDPQAVAPGADAAAQLSGIGRAPLRYGRLLVATFYSALPLYGMGCVGWLGQHEVLLPTVMYVGLPLVWIATAVLDREDPPALTRFARGLCAVLFAVACAAVMTMAYLGWNPVGAPTLRGVQGRYLLPLLPLLAGVLPARGWSVGERAGGLYAVAAGIALATAVVGVARQYYDLG